MTESKEKPNCYKCQYRGTIPGDCHSRCNHPSVGQDINNLAVKGDAHGIRSGWFMWPANFDPTWLLTCNGFTAKKEADNVAIRQDK